jgi:release factor glutamine methyltransferase
MRTVGQLLAETERRLSAAGIDDARLEAELVWMTALDLDRTHLFASLRSPVQHMALRQAEGLVARRMRHEPAAYIMGHREFYGLDFLVAPGVLVPRPDTETVVDEALRLLGRRSPDSGPPVIADVGTGSGAIAVSLAVRLPSAVVYGTDISDRALELASSNAQRHGVAGRVRLLKGDLLSPVDQPLDLVAANMPYVMSSEIPTLEPEIRLHEPREALDGGGDGLEVIGRLLATARPHLKSNAALVLELDPRQVQRATQLARAAFPVATITTAKDFTHRPRVLTVQL